MDFRNHRAAWTGKELVDKTDSWQYHFSAAENAEIRSLAERLVASMTPEQLRHLKPKDCPLPSLERQLARMSDDLELGRGFILLRGLEVDMSQEVVEAAYLALGAHLGVFVGQNASGDLLGHVRDDGSDPSDPTVRKYRLKVEQPFHVDGSDAVGLLCLKTAKSGGKSSIVSSVTIYNELVRRRPDLEPLTREPLYLDSYGQHKEGEDPWFKVPVFTGTRDNPSFFYIRWYVDQCQGVHPQVPRLRKEQIELLDLIDQLADEFKLDMDFQPGDIQLLSNRVILHAREGYEDWDEPDRKRHLLRLWLTLHRNAVDGKGVGGIDSKNGVKGLEPIAVSAKI